MFIATVIYLNHASVQSFRDIYIFGISLLLTQPTLFCVIVPFCLCPLRLLPFPSVFPPSSFFLVLLLFLPVRLFPPSAQFGELRMQKSRFPLLKFLFYAGFGPKYLCVLRLLPRILLF